ncbi:hypothetical protein IMG5_002390 [Ichthyophthirius multifiliis]|uniref:Transmembrane protein n=1 Tax=Ichthyophthirius multifiliis TaxID=5932 RepID=G0QJ43_ICHMU|nr:hypothetical protein IMG5_002390 [Ichthyophthirius multifiliis]EGR34767.1 hypothetical protein IMG5_002390 [Ichthyophthirius multifiliis]|eukprot:XP_004040071.1 hypothetical protein IMG5_002390 [Ichthyophthirius multifiliis]
MFQSYRSLRRSKLESFYGKIKFKLEIYERVLVRFDALGNFFVIKYFMCIFFRYFSFSLCYFEFYFTHFQSCYKQNPFLQNSLTFFIYLDLIVTQISYMRWLNYHFQMPLKVFAFGNLNFILNNIFISFENISSQIYLRRYFFNFFAENIFVAQLYLVGFFSGICDGGIFNNEDFQKREFQVNLKQLVFFFSSQNG